MKKIKLTKAIVMMINHKMDLFEREQNVSFHKHENEADRKTKLPDYPNQRICDRAAHRSNHQAAPLTSAEQNCEGPPLG